MPWEFKANNTWKRRRKGVEQALDKLEKTIYPVKGVARKAELDWQSRVKSSMKGAHQEEPPVGLYWRRREAGYSQTELADLCGITQQQISRYERLLVTPHHSTVRKMAEVLKCRVKDLYTRFIEP